MMQNLGISLQEVKIVAHMDHKLLVYDKTYR